MEGTAKMKAQLEHSYDDVNDPNRRNRKLGYFDWVGMDLEEHAAQKKRDKEKTVLDSLPKRLRVPSRYAPAFLPSLLLGVLVLLHVLVQLLQHWLVGFQVWMNYREMDADQPELQRWMDQEESRFDPVAAATCGDAASTAAALAKALELGHDDPLLARFAIAEQRLPSYLPTHARVVPAKGRHVLVPLTYYPTLGMTLEYHRRRYVYQPESNLWSKVRCRTDFGLKVLERWQGMDSVQHWVCGQIRYGSNLFSVKQPTFGELYRKQLLSPFTVFQLFCVILWLLDSYWQYSVFTLVMILIFEATVVFSRLKSLQALRGMGNKSRPVLVHRQGTWIMIDSTALLPGDIMSLTRVRPHFAKKEITGNNDDKKEGSTEESKKGDDAAAAAKAKTETSRKMEDEGGDIVPADLLLLRGSTVVNEASLTGESIPQMKEGLSELEEGERLNMKDRHKMNVVYAGTKMLQCKGVGNAVSADGDEISSPKLFQHISDPPDGGCVCFVLRTGFSSAQGKLVRMIEGSQEKVKGHERDTGFLLLLLFFFALASSSYVLYHGLRNDNRSQYELLLHCILIITSVIPPDLPMQTAMAVNNSLMTLMKLQVFCTEPNRVPIAGKLDACLFDKTGTLTTDELVAVGVCEPSKLRTRKGTEDEDEHFLTPMTKVANEAGLVLAGCNSLIVVEDETIGDPLENAALSAMRWKLSSSTGHAVPAPATGKLPEGKVIKLGGGESISDVEVITRHHFSSKLQRMSCVVRSFSRYYSVAKGSSEAIGSLLAVKPAGYDDKAKYLSKQGYRVIALAYKNLSSIEETESAKDSRTNCEANLVFAGFIAFTCRVRKDTAMVLKRLKEGGMSIAMVTGDALLTAVHVAKEVAIFEPINDAVEDDVALEETNEELRAFLEEKRARAGNKSKLDKKQRQYRPILLLEQMEGGKLTWCSYEDGREVVDYVAGEVPVLANLNDLATTGKSLTAALEFDEGTKKILGYIKVFARMTPDAKETVIECLHSVGSLCLMCGDGANDVGALKQADVGVALLSGFGDVNVDKGEDGVKKEKKDSNFTAVMSQQHLNEIRILPVMLIKLKLRQMGADPSKYPEIIEKEDLIKLYQIKAREIAIKEHDQKNAKSKAKQTTEERQIETKIKMMEKQKRMQDRIDELTAQGESWPHFKVMREFWASEMEDNKKRKQEAVSMNGVEGSAAAIVAQLEDMETGALPMVKLGDASIAAPFTSKMPSIRSCVDIVRQGRCTLVSSIQMVRGE
jgi:cation-transporting ATPase 13A1